MGVLSNVKRTKFYLELSEEERKKIFSIKEKKFLHHIDTFYYSVFLKFDTVLDVSSNIIEMLEMLNDLKCQLHEEKKKENQNSIWISQDLNLQYCDKRNRIYDHCITVNGMWDIFISSSLPNDKTPRVHVQLRSFALWSLGEKESIEQSFKCLKYLLNIFDVQVLKVQENRIDYCYHTNSIQNIEEVYSDDNLKKSLDTNLRIYSKVGRFSKGEINVEYLSLGNRKSNNLFFRSYNKTREVCEMAYKGFFFDIWLSNGLISNYDYEVYIDCYNRQRYDSLEYSMMNYYIKYGKDNFYKDMFKSIMDNPNSTIQQVRKAIRGVLPYPTVILNIEYQTMRKFYYYGDLIDVLPLLTDTKEDDLVRLYQIIDNRKIFLNYLTSLTVSFKRNVNLSRKDESKLTDKEIYQDFWYRLRKTKVDGFKETDYVRKYNKSHNIDLLKKRIKGNIASLSLYMGNECTYLDDDLSCFISLLNDNSVETLVDEYGNIKYFDEEYNRIKNKRKKALSSYL